MTSEQVPKGASCADTWSVEAPVSQVNSVYMTHLLSISSDDQTQFVCLCDCLVVGHPGSSLSWKAILSGRASVRWKHSSVPLASAELPGDTLSKGFLMSLASLFRLSPSWSRLRTNSSLAPNLSSSVSELNRSRRAAFRLTYEPFSSSNKEPKMVLTWPHRGVGSRLIFSASH